MKSRVVTLEGTYIRNAKTGFYAPAEATEHYPCRLCIWIAVDIAAAALLGGAGYAVWQAWLALAA